MLIWIWGGSATIGPTVAAAKLVREVNKTNPTALKTRAIRAPVIKLSPASRCDTVRELRLGNSLIFLRGADRPGFEETQMIRRGPHYSKRRVPTKFPLKTIVIRTLLRAGRSAVFLKRLRHPPAVQVVAGP